MMNFPCTEIHFVVNLLVGSDLMYMHVESERIMEPVRIVISPIIYIRIHAMRDSPLLPDLKKIYVPNNTYLDLSSALFLTSESTLDGDVISDREFFVPFLSSLHIGKPWHEQKRILVW